MTTAGATSPPGYCSTAFSTRTDSVSPGRKEDVSFFWAPSNLPENGPPTPRKTRSVMAKTSHLPRWPEGIRNSRLMPFRSQQERWFRLGTGSRTLGITTRKRSGEQGVELLGLGHRPLAREVLAHVGRRAPV